jgi:hypothetical protein
MKSVTEAAETDNIFAQRRDTNRIVESELREDESEDENGGL